MTMTTYTEQELPGISLTTGDTEFPVTAIDINGAVDGDGVPRPDGLREAPLERFDERPLGEKIRLQRSHNGGDVVFTDGLSAVGNHGRAKRKT